MSIPFIIFIAAIVCAVLGILKQKFLWKMMGFVLVVMVAVFSLIDSYDSNIDQRIAELSLSHTKDELFKTQNDLFLLRKYSYVANYGIYGGEHFLGPGLATDSRLYNLLTDTYYSKDNKFFYYCGDKFEKIYKQIIVEFPDFPFSFYALADCKNQRRESDWIDYANKGIEIFEWTTKIGGHNRQHDDCMNNLLEFKKEFAAKGEM